jgi:hypothetical protein
MTSEFPKFDRADYLHRNAQAAEQRAKGLLAATEAADAQIKAAEEEIRRAHAKLSQAQQAWVRCREAEGDFTADMNGPLVDVIDNLTGQVVGTGHVTGDRKSEWFGLDYRASFRRECYTIVPADVRTGPKPAHVR